MTPPIRTAALIVAAGQGLRSGSTTPKQFATLAGKPMVAHSHAALVRHAAIDRVVLVVGEGQEPALEAAIGPAEHVIGGATRRLSVRAGLEALASDPPERVLIHDAARPFLSAAAIDRLLDALDSHQGAVPALPISDTLALGADARAMKSWAIPCRGTISTVSRRPRRFGSTSCWPRIAHGRGDEPTDDAQMVRRHGGTVALVEGDPMLEKITHPADFAAAEARHAAAHARAERDGIRRPPACRGRGAVAGRHPDSA